MTRVIGYTRELLPGTGTTPGTDDLTRAGAELIFADDGPAEARARPGLDECLHSLEPGDALVVTSAAHLSSAVPHFVATVAGLRRRGVVFRSLSEPALCAGVGASVDPGEVLLALEALRQRLAGLQTRAGMATAAEEAGGRGVRL